MIAVTILAFVYVPLNLATSIFGMNLSELNGSGQELWVFLTTAVIALVITGVSWFLIEEVYNYLRWQRSYDNRMRQKRGHDPRVRLTIGARMSMLALLWKYEHKNWLWRSGAWWRILTNNSSQLSEPTQADELNACEYVLKHMMDIRYDSEHAFKPDTIYEWK